MRGFLRFAAFLPCLLALVPVPSAAAGTNIFGTVFDTSGRPVLNLVVGIQRVDATTGSTVATTSTDPTNASYSFAPAGGGRGSRFRAIMRRCWWRWPPGRAERL